jgi:hypothetical protein
LALGKSLAEVRALPYPEFRRWQLFYMLEPWGFQNDEYRTASILTMLFNINRGKRKSKSEKDFMRNLPKKVLEEIRKLTADPEEMTDEEIIAAAQRNFGIK